MSTPKFMALADLVESAKSGFACGEEAPDGVFQVRMNNVTREGKLDTSKRRLVPRGHKAITDSLLRDGDVLFNATNSPDLVGKTTLFTDSGEPTVFSNHFIRIRCSSALDPSYLARWLHLQFHRGKYKRMCRQWVNQATVGKDSLLTVQVPVLPLPEQRRIAEVLDRADALRAKRREAIVRLDELTQSLFLDMFGDPGTNTKNWPVCTIGELIESARYGTSEKASTSGEIPVLRMNNITARGRMDLSDLKYLPLQPKDDRYLVSAGDILFNRTNSADLVGKTAVYREPQPMAYAGYLVRVRANSENHPEYIAAFLNTTYAKRTLRNICKSIVGMANINARELQKIKVPAPPFSLQSKFAERISVIERFRRQQMSSGISGLDDLFASLQQRAFRGEL